MPKEAFEIVPAQPRVLPIDFKVGGRGMPAHQPGADRITSGSGGCGGGCPDCKCVGLRSFDKAEH